MSVSTDGQICFGNVYEEDFEFPWENHDIESWWRKECGFKPSVELYDESGEYVNGVKPSQDVIDAYYKEHRDFDLAHVLPVELVNYCSGEFPMWIIAVPSSCRSNNRGYAERFEPGDLTVTKDEIATLRDFCIKYDLIPSEDAGWYLTSCWG